MGDSREFIAGWKPVAIIPLNQAVGCADCGMVTQGPVVCGSCGSGAIAPVVMATCAPRAVTVEAEHVFGPAAPGIPAEVIDLVEFTNHELELVTGGIS